MVSNLEDNRYKQRDSLLVRKLLHHSSGKNEYDMGENSSVISDLGRSLGSELADNDYAAGGNYAYDGDVAKLSAHNITISYGDVAALKNVTLNIFDKSVTAFIGPSGCGKSSLLRCFNRMNDLIDNCKIKGSVIFDGHDIYGEAVDPVVLRSKIGMVFQKPNPFPKSIYDNVAYGPKIHGLATSKADMDAMVESALRRTFLWDEVKDRLDRSAVALSGGQQQRLCIARAIATNPKVLLMDEPCSALDPIATAKIEELISELGKTCAVLVVTHSMQQAARVSERTAFFYFGELAEYAKTEDLFTRPMLKATEEYITGRFG